MFPEKRRSGADLPSLAEGWRKAGMSVVFADGCFDPLHADLVRQLRAAREEGDVLVVGVHPDSGAASRLGAPHPLVDAEGRMTILAAVECVDVVVPVPDGGAAEIVEALKPNRRVEIREHPLAVK